jgi:hypothetical protein
MQPLTTVRPRMAMAHLCQAPWPIGRRPAATCSVGVQGEPRGGAQRALGLPGTIRSPRLLWLHHLSPQPNFTSPPIHPPDPPLHGHGFWPVWSAVQHRQEKACAIPTHTGAMRRSIPVLCLTPGPLLSFSSQM